MTRVLAGKNAGMTMLTRWRHFWQRLSLTRQLVLLAILPTVVVATAILLITSVQHLRGLQVLLQANAQTLAYQLAAAAESPLTSRNRRELLQLARTGISQADTLRVKIWSGEGELLAGAEHQNAASTRDVLQVSAPVGSATADAAPGQVTVEVDLGALHRAQIRGWRNVLLILGIGLLAVLGAGAWAAGRIVAPVRHLGQAMEQLGAGESVTVPETGGAEIGQLQRGFNRTALKLSEHHEEMQARIRDATAELAQKNRQLQGINQARVRLLAAASHDLRQPLHALALFSEGLLRDESDPQRRQRLTRMQECVTQLDQMFSELLDFTRLNTGTSRPRHEDFALDTVFRDINSTFGPVAEEQQLRLIIRPTPLWARSDPIMLKRIIANLVSNALRNTDTGGVLLAARRRGATAQIEIMDTGVGMAAEHLDHIFEEFYRIEQTGRTPSHGPGLGLGLATVKRLSRLLRIRLQLRSTVGRGTHVRLRIPLAQPAMALPAPAKPDTRSPIRRLRVLAVDDEALILAGLQDALSPWDCQFLAARSTADALPQLDALDGPLDVVLCDLNLGAGESGLDVAAQLVRHAHGMHTGTVRLVITAEADPSQLQAARDQGYGILHKPVAPARLRQVIVEMLDATAPDPRTAIPCAAGRASGETAAGSEVTAGLPSAGAQAIGELRPRPHA